MGQILLLSLVEVNQKKIVLRMGFGGWIIEILDLKSDLMSDYV